MPEAATRGKKIMLPRISVCNMGLWIKENVKFELIGCGKGAVPRCSLLGTLAQS